ncbi:TolC family protein [Sulfurovum sp.]|uniref:TolC family protein n=1 Tax=Sulfurovum sp. TaxID=1969726 RepID=UPI0025D1A580|nr:TolC family protein [Sulfurovum sp.]
MRIIFSILLILGLLQAQSIDQLVKHALKKHPSLKAIQHRLSSMDERTEKSQKWANPDLSVTINDIQFRKPFDRSLERMQYNAVNFKQKFPWFGKLDARKTYAEEQKSVVFHSYEAARVQLALQIRTTAFTVKELEARIGILRSYMQLETQNIKLYTDMISTDTMSHSDSVSAELSLSRIEIRLERYRSLLQAQKEKLSYLVQRSVAKINDKLRIKRPGSLKQYLNRLSHNATYRMKLSQNRTADANKALVDLEVHPDPYVKVGYFNRPDFPDYASVTVGISLPLYGTEKLNSEIARKEALSSRSSTLDYKVFLKSEIRTNYAKLKEAYRIYNIIQRESLPQLGHMLELGASAIEEGADLFTYTNILEQKLALEEESISMKAEYQRTKAKLKALTGEI